MLIFSYKERELNLGMLPFYTDFKELSPVEIQ